jgi:hypothetical protein
MIGDGAGQRIAHHCAVTRNFAERALHRDAGTLPRKFQHYSRPSELSGELRFRCKSARGARLTRLPKGARIEPAELYAVLASAGDGDTGDR